MPWTFVSFLLEILLRTLDVIVLAGSSLVLSFSEKIWIFQICLPKILQNFLENFSHSSFCLILTQVFEPFHCLRSPWCNFSCKFSIIGSNSALKHSCKLYIGHYLTREILIFSYKVQFLENDETSFYCCILYITIIQELLVKEWVFMHFQLENNFLHLGRK